jgi:hypothetical protein
MQKLTPVAMETMAAHASQACLREAMKAPAGLVVQLEILGRAAVSLLGFVIEHADNPTRLAEELAENIVRNAAEIRRTPH